MAITNSDFDYVRNLVRYTSALVLEPGKEYLVESRLAPLARQHGFSSLQHMLHNMRSGGAGDLEREVVEAMTTNETSFFREMRVFELFRKMILPELLARRAPKRSLNLWCAACSGGQEPYSIAMLLREYFPSLEGWNIQLIASDISREMIARARLGRYSQSEVNRGLPSHLLVKYFQKHGDIWEISEQIRHMVEFREINLIRDWPPLPRMNVIFMRNVLIYFDLLAKQDILSRVRNLLDVDGCVFLGGAETTTNLDDSFESVSMDGAMYFRMRTKCDFGNSARMPVGHRSG
jgi:chemotaxis protein methyltransferase CheR